jgi:hypothetical protein
MANGNREIKMGTASNVMSRLSSRKKERKKERK